MPSENEIKAEVECIFNIFMHKHTHATTDVS